VLRRVRKRRVLLSGLLFRHVQAAGEEADSVAARFEISRICSSGRSIERSFLFSLAS
jgi:hypothetical protein